LVLPLDERIHYFQKAIWRRSVRSFENNFVALINDAIGIGVAEGAGHPIAPKLVWKGL
jgi:hypothetical protein